MLMKLSTILLTILLLPLLGHSQMLLTSLEVETQGFYTQGFDGGATLQYFPENESFGAVLGFSMQRGFVGANSGAFKDYPIEGTDFDSYFYRFNTRIGAAVRVSKPASVAASICIDRYQYSLAQGLTPYFQGMRIYPEIRATWAVKRIGLTVASGMIDLRPNNFHYSAGIVLRVGD